MEFPPRVASLGLSVRMRPWVLWEDGVDKLDYTSIHSSQRFARQSSAPKTRQPPLFLTSSNYFTPRSKRSPAPNGPHLTSRSHKGTLRSGVDDGAGPLEMRRIWRRASSSTRRLSLVVISVTLLVIMSDDDPDVVLSFPIREHRRRPSGHHMLCEGIY